MIYPRSLSGFAEIYYCFFRLFPVVGFFCVLRFCFRLYTVKD